MSELPANTPTWVAIAALALGWIGSNVWPAVRDAFSQRMGTTTAIARARAEAELVRSEREVKAEEDQANAERQIAEALLKLTQLVEVNIAETRQNTQVLTSLSTAFSVQIGQMPTLRDLQQTTERISAIEAHLALQNPSWFGRRSNDIASGDR